MELAHLIVGLGNPGTDYAQTRHNAGFLLAEEVARRAAAEWRLEKRFEARLARGRLAGRELLVCEPQTYMNASGKAVAAVCRYYRLPLDGLLVAVDDADLPLGTIRLRPEGSSGGHHGLESLEAHLGSRHFARLRLGIGRRAPSERRLTGHVLGRFAADEWELMQAVLDRAADQVECWMQAGVAQAMNQYNGTLPGTGNDKAKL